MVVTWYTWEKKTPKVMERRLSVSGYKSNVKNQEWNQRLVCAYLFKAPVFIGLILVLDACNEFVGHILLSGTWDMKLFFSSHNHLCPETCYRKHSFVWTFITLSCQSFTSLSSKVSSFPSGITGNLRFWEKNTSKIRKKWFTEDGYRSTDRKMWTRWIWNDDNWL